MRNIKMSENRSKCYLPHEYTSKNITRDRNTFYKNMFIDDIVTGIIPVSLNRDKYDIQVTIECDKNDLDLVKDILNGFSNYSEKFDLKQLVKDAIEGIARSISWYGDAVYEIYKNENDIKLINLRANKFIDCKFFYIQLPPQKKLPKLINKKTIWKISIPKSLQTKYSYKRILTAIDKFGSMMPKYIEDELHKGNAFHYYDSKIYREKQFWYVNDLTSEWGWNQRDTSEEFTTEFFRNYKYIKFDLSQAIFREHIIIELNHLFKKLNIKAFITIENIPTSDDYKKHIQNFISNKISYNEVFTI